MKSTIVTKTGITRKRIARTSWLTMIASSKNANNETAGQHITTGGGVTTRRTKATRTTGGLSCSRTGTGDISPHLFPSLLFRRGSMISSVVLPPPHTTNTSSGANTTSSSNSNVTMMMNRMLSRIQLVQEKKKDQSSSLGYAGRRRHHHYHYCYSCRWNSTSISTAPQLQQHHPNEDEQQLVVGPTTMTNNEPPSSLTYSVLSSSYSNNINRNDFFFFSTELAMQWLTQTLLVAATTTTATSSSSSIVMIPTAHRNHQHHYYPFHPLWTTATTPSISSSSHTLLSWPSSTNVLETMIHPPTEVEQTEFWELRRRKHLTLEFFANLGSAMVRHQQYDGEDSRDIVNDDPMPNGHKDASSSSLLLFSSSPEKQYEQQQLLPTGDNNMYRLGFDQPVSAVALPAPAPRNNDEIHQDVDTADPAALEPVHVIQPVSSSSSNAIEITHTVDASTMSSDSSNRNKQKLAEVTTRMNRAIKGNDIKAALRAYHEAFEMSVASDLYLSDLRGLFDFICFHQRPFDAYDILRHYYHVVTRRQVESQSALSSNTTMATDHTPMDNASTMENGKQQNEALNPIGGIGSSKSTHVPRYHHPHPAYPHMCDRVCDVLRYVNPSQYPPGRIQSLVRSLMFTLQHTLDQHDQLQCLPVLLSALLDQKSVAAGKLAHVVYDTIVHAVDHGDLSVPNGYWDHLLEKSKYFRQYDVPYDEILHRMVFDLHRRPDPTITCNVLLNYFPFDHIEATYQTLYSIVELQRQFLRVQQQQQQQQLPLPDDLSNQKSLIASAVESVEKKKFFTTLNPSLYLKLVNDTRKKQERKQKQRKLVNRGPYIVDMAILEAIGAVGASHGRTDLCLLVWDYVDLLQYAPSEGLYENTILTFLTTAKRDTSSSSPSTLKSPLDHYTDAYCALIDMEQQAGYYPSRALIRSMSAQIRDSESKIASAREALQQVTTIHPFISGTTTDTTTTTNITTTRSSSNSGTTTTNTVSTNGMDQRISHESMGRTMTVACLNVLLSVHAERGNVEACLSMLRAGGDFMQYGLEPDLDSYAYAMESVGKYLLRHRDGGDLLSGSSGNSSTITQYSRDRRTQNILDATDEILRWADDLLLLASSTSSSSLSSSSTTGKIIAMKTASHHFIREYVEVLCFLNELETAQQVIEDRIQSGQLVNDKTIYRVAMGYVYQQQKFVEARQLSLYAQIQPFTFLLDKIDKEERKWIENQESRQYSHDHQEYQSS